MEDHAGQAVTPAGEHRLYHFWATFCAPCVAELPTLQRNAPRLAAGGLAVYAIANEADWTAVDRVFPNGVPDFVYRMTSPDYAAAQVVHVLPTTLIVGGDGKVERRLEGAVDWDAVDPGHLEAVRLVGH